MRMFVILLAVSALFVWGCTGGEDRAEAPAPDDAEPATKTADHAAESGESEKAALNKAEPGGVYGEGITIENAVSLADILAEPEKFEGKPVLVEATIAEVCPRRGCWVELTDADHSMRVKVTDGVIVFPLSAKGHAARIEGVVEKLEFTLEEARAMKEHEAEEKGEAFDPATVTGPEVVWRIRGKGAEIEG